MRKTLAYLLICLFVYLFISPKPLVRAEGEFRADYTVLYQVNLSGKTIVDQQIVLTNLLPNVYPKEYSIVLDTENIGSVIAFDSLGSLSPQVTRNDGKTEISVAFKDQVVGLGNKLRFTMRYENTEIAQKNGTIWEINIPGIVDSKELGEYTVSLQVPSGFGQPAYMTPYPAKDKKWTRKQMTQGGVSIAYGRAQYFTLLLTYYLENKSSVDKFTEIALPPDTAFQRVIVRSLEPKPQEVVVDADGNWLARYHVDRGQTQKIDGTFTVETRLAARDDFPREIVDVSSYIAATRYWNSASAEIQLLAKKYSTPRAIYDYVVSALSYDYTRASGIPIRMGSLEALSTPQKSVCMEFTDTFIAIARAAGIAARQVVGYAYTTNTKLRPLSLVSDVLHAWPEYYDTVKQRWIPVDPTWGNTTGGIDYFEKLDFNHITFAINGKRDDYPYPAGAYRRTDVEEKVVTVDFAQAESALLTEAKALGAEIEFPTSVVSGLPAHGALRVTNNSGMARFSIPLSIQSTPADVAITKSIFQLPPYGVHTEPLEFSTHSFFSRGPGLVRAVVADTTIEHTFTIHPLYLYAGALIGGGLALCIGVWILYMRKSTIWKAPSRVS